MSYAHLTDSSNQSLLDVYCDTINCRALNIVGQKFYDVKSYGAVGDGVTDDIKAIRACFAEVRQTGGTMLFPPGTYRVTGGFGTEPSQPADLVNGVTIKGENAEILIDRAALPLVPPSTRIICLEGNNNAVENMRFRGSVTFDMNIIPTTYYPPIIIAIEIGGKAATYNGLPDNLAYYKQNARVVGCDFKDIDSPIILSQVSNALIMNNNISRWMGTAIVAWTCPQSCFIVNNRMSEGNDDCIFLFNLKAPESAWAAAGLYAGGHVVHGNYCEKTRAKFVGTAGYSDIIISNNVGYLSFNAGIVVEADPNIFASGLMYNKRIKIIGNTLGLCGRYYNTNAGWDYWRGPVAGENMGISTWRSPGTTIGLRARNITIEDNMIWNPSGNGLDIHKVDQVICNGNTIISGTWDQGSGPVATGGYPHYAEDCTDVAFKNSSVLQEDGVAWVATYALIPPNLPADSCHIVTNWVKNGPETFQGLNPTSNPTIVKWYPLVVSP